MIFAAPSYRTADHNLEQRVVTYLFSRNVAELRHLKVEAIRGIVTLRGHVGTFHQKQLCLNCCQRVAGVIRIDDQILVDAKS